MTEKVQHEDVFYFPDKAGSIRLISPSIVRLLGYTEKENEYECDNTQ